MRDHDTVEAENKAIEWLVKLNAPDLAEQEQEEFMQWLQASMVNQAAYIKAEQLWQQGEVLAGQPVSKEERPVLSSFFKFNAWQNTAVAFSFVLLFGFAVWFLMPGEIELQSYETLVGEQKELQLEDGSEVAINTGTKLEVSYSEEYRVTTLLKGEAFFDVKSEPDRPFEVQTRFGRVRVLGTRFAVRETGEDIIVTVIEGKVALYSNANIDKEIQAKAYLTANERISMSAAKSGIEATTLDADSQLAWRKKQLIFRNESLQTVVAELDRYFPQDLVLLDESLANKKITAVIKISDLGESLEGLEYSLNLKAKQEGHSYLGFK